MDVIRLVFVALYSSEVLHCLTTTVIGSQVQLNCPHNVQSYGIIIWTSLHSNSVLPLSENTKIYISVPTELRQRLNITGDHSTGEYNLVISDVRKTDEGQYECHVYGDPVKLSKKQLVVIEGPTSVIISNKQDNNLPGTEDHVLTIKCTANGGDPAPNMKLTIGNYAYTKSNTHTIQIIISNVNRSYDGVSVTCQAGYDGVTYTPQTNIAVIRLELKPLIPSFSMNPVVTENTQSLILTCTSTGSRPAPTEWIWLIGERNVDITSNSTSVSSSQQSDGTFTASSTLNFKVLKDFNRQLIKCGFKNTASGNNYVQNSTTVEVRYAPSVSVPNKTFTLTQSSREIHCVVDGNPTSSFFKWQQRSKYGELIRALDGSSTLVLPINSEEDRYQDTGEYVCTASNGIRDEDGNLDQKGSGYVISHAPPRFLNGSSQVKLGQYGSNVDIEVNVYSVPEYSSPIWMRDGSPLKQSSKYIMSDFTDVITDTFYGTTIKVDGFRITLTIRNLAEQDFDNYTLRLSNVVGETVEYLVILKVVGPPDEPHNVTDIYVTVSTVTLQWIPGYDGGYKQRFAIQYRIKNLKKWNEKEVSEYDHTSSVGSKVFTLTGLEPGTLYEIRIYSRNVIGRSLSTDIEKVSTKCSVYDMDSSTVTGVAIGLSLVIVVALISIGLLTFRLSNAKKMLTARNSPNSRLVDRKSYPEVYYNIAEENNDKDPGSELEERSYETLGTKDEPSEYEGLDRKTRGDKQRIGMKGENYETLGMKDKPNVYEELDQKPNDDKSKIYSNTLV